MDRILSVSELVASVAAGAVFGAVGVVVTDKFWAMEVKKGSANFVTPKGMYSWLKVLLPVFVTGLAVNFLLPMVPLINTPVTLTFALISSGAPFAYMVQGVVVNKLESK